MKSFKNSRGKKKKTLTFQVVSVICRRRDVRVKAAWLILTIIWIKVYMSNRFPKSKSSNCKNHSGNKSLCSFSVVNTHVWFSFDLYQWKEKRIYVLGLTNDEGWGVRVNDVNKEGVGGVQTNRWGHVLEVGLCRVQACDPPQSRYPLPDVSWITTATTLFSRNFESNNVRSRD